MGVSSTAEPEAFKSFTIMVKLQLGSVWHKVIYNFRNPCHTVTTLTNPRKNLDKSM